MSVEENLRVMDAMMEAFNAKDWDRFLSYFAGSLVRYAPDTAGPMKGREAFRQENVAFTTAFPDVRGERVRAFGQGDWVCFEETITGTHKGPLRGPGGQTIPATNKSVRFPFCGVWKLEGGKFVEIHSYWDQLGIMAQLGLAPKGGP